VSTKENKELVRQVYKCWDEIAGDVVKLRSMFDKYYTPSFVYHEWDRDMNLEQTIQYMASFVTAFPDLKCIIDDLVSEKDKVVTRYTMKLTHKGSFMGIPATGKEIVMKAVKISKVSGGKSAEIWNYPDSLGLLTQLGVITSPK
jgi:steroid delta-isomerase-like uncharacterized protein